MKQKFTPLAASILSGVAVALIFFVFAYIEDRRYLETLHSHAISQLSQVRAELEAGINANFYLSRGLIAFVSSYPDMEQDTFHRIAENLLRNPNFVRNLALAPDNIVSFVHPLEGNEKAIGLNFEKNEKQWPTVKKAIDSGETVIAGPVDLVQGGTAFISRTPIYIDSDDAARDKSYWGMASIVIDKDQLLGGAGFYKPNLGIKIALRGTDGLGEQGGFIAGDQTVFQADPAVLAVHLPEGSWQLAAVPLGGWGMPSPFQIWIRYGGAILSLLTGFWIFTWLRKQTQTKKRIESALKKAEQAEEKLLFANTILTSQMEVSLDGVLVVDDKDKILLINQRFVDIWKIPAEVLQESSGQLTLEFILDQVENPELFKDRIKSLYNSKEEKCREDIHLKDERILDAYSTPMIGPDGAYYGRTWYYRDITDQTRMELELLKVKKLESIGILAGGIAHDFNNILAAILGNINLALRRLKPDEKVLPLLKEAEKASLRAKGLTLQLLTFSKGGEPIKEVCSIEEVIRESADFVLRGTNVRCEWDFAENLSPAEIDPGQIGQAIQNIALNASHAMPEGGVVAISCRNIKSTQEPTMHLDDGDYLKVTIKDSGMGIPADLVDKIFDPYYTTKQTGSGLGLAITHSIINRHNGHIRVESTPGEGTVFTLYLPAFVGIDISAQQDTSQPAQTGSGLILIMDDDEMLRNIVQEMLEDGGYQVLQASDGDEAIDIYQKSVNPIDAVIMDLTIPGGMGGKDAVKNLLAIDPAAKVIVSSGYSHDPIVANYQNYGFCGAIGKPYVWQELEGILRQVL